MKDIAARRLRLFGERLRQARQFHGCTQFKLASLLELAGTGPLVEWEKGRRRPRINTLDRLATVLDVSYEESMYWRGLTGYLPDAPPPSAQQISAGLEPYARYMAQLPHPVYITDLRYVPWVGNPVMFALMRTTGDFDSLFARPVTILQLLFDSTLGFASTVNEIAVFQVEQVQRYKGFNFMHRHASYYLDTPQQMQAALPSDDYRRFKAIWQDVNAIHFAGHDFNAVAGMRLGLLEINCPRAGMDQPVRYQVVTRTLPEFGGFFILSQMIPQDTAAFEVCLARSEVRLPSDSIRLYDLLDVNALLATY